jgi:hypothetical protein
MTYQTMNKYSEELTKYFWNMDFTLAMLWRIGWQPKGSY